MLNRVAPAPLFKAYEALVEKFYPEAILLVDGGTDSLMRGDEAKLGSPEEDMASMCAVDKLLSVKKKFMVCIGFGIDSHHGVNHFLFLENVASLIKTGGFLGTFTAMKEMEEVKFYQKACKYSFTKMQTSIVSGSISAAVDGEYGDVKFTSRTGGSKLWINPLMSIYWCFYLDHVARNRYNLEELKKARNFNELYDTLYDRDEKKVRMPQIMPV